MERRKLDGEVHALVSDLLERDGFLAAFTERRGGVSPAPYDSLNVGPETGDDPDRVGRNLELLAQALGTSLPARVRQVHGSRVFTEGGSSGGQLPEADALVTSRQRTPVAVVVADCVPLVLASARERSVAAVHIGWRGLAAGIVPEALGSFNDPAHLKAAIGPAIGPCHYEVNEDVVEAVARGTGGIARKERRGRSIRLDLAGSVAALLQDLGVSEIDRDPSCTACEPERFFSHRRDGTTGRQAAVGMML